MPTAIIGTGTWGTAMAVALARHGHDVVLWGRDPTKVADLAAARRHAGLAGVDLAPRIRCSADAADLPGCDLALWAVPTQHSAGIARRLRGALPDVPTLSLSKGFEEGTHRRLSQILADEAGLTRIGVVSGPSHAEEVAHGRPAFLVTAGPTAVVEAFIARAHGPLRLYSSTDLVGVEVAGALKNVIAIAAGIGDGLGLGDNLKAALITRGLAEIRRLGRALGAEDATFAGLAGVGDLLTTCYSPHGRNRALGLAVAQGEDAQAWTTRVGMVAEGMWTCRAALALGLKHGVQLPLTSAVASVLWAARPVALAMEDLLARSPKEENA